LRVIQRWLAISLVACVICAIYLSLRNVAPPDASLIDRTIKEAEPLQQLSDGRAFTTIIKGYTYTLTPKATCQAQRPPVVLAPALALRASVSVALDEIPNSDRTGLRGQHRIHCAPLQRKARAGLEDRWSIPVSNRISSWR
jgi:hypothetical protein